MKAQLIDAADRNHPRKGSFRSDEFLRMVRRVLRYRGLLTVGIVASVFYAMLHSVSIFGALPVLKVLLEDEGFHGWIARSTAAERLGLDLVRPAADAASRSDDLLVTRNRHVDDACAAAVRPGDTIVPPDGTDTPTWLAEIASAPNPTTVAVHVRPPGQLDLQPVTHDFILADPSPAWRLAGQIARWIPDDNSPRGKMTILACVLAAVVLVVIVANACRFVSEYFVSRAVLLATMSVRRDLYAKILRLPMARFTRNVGDLVTRFVQDVQDVQRGMLTLFGKTIREPIRAAFLLTLALTLDWRVTLTMLLIGPWALLIFWKIGTRVKKANRKLLRGYGVMLDALTDTLSAIPIVKAYTTENVERRRLMHIDHRMFRHQLSIIRLDALLSPMLEILGVLAASGVTVWLGGRVLAGEIDPAKFGTLVLALAMLFDPLRKLADVYTRIQRSAAGAERLCETLDAPDERTQSTGTLQLVPVQSTIEFRGVTFTYPESDRPALNDVNLTVRRGETVALVGRNGSGKTTLVNLLTRFYDPQLGAILFDGVDIREADLRSLRGQFGLVTQDSVVLPIPLADNIAYGRRNGTRETVIAAAQRAYADEFIRDRPLGYDEIPGQGGRTLSGGQRQRIAIARAIYRDAPVLIFDEATSQVDTESEQKIQAALTEFARGRTTFLIAHRLSTISFATRIVVLDAGRVIDTGPHADLLTRCPLYRVLCETQLVH
ncbi:MAG: ABC transporter ATP-binding protein [Phycisphaerales bacterium]|nr:ABC transporter ATP-binding protein [Phycisphaerales bacterium]